MNDPNYASFAKIFEAFKVSIALFMCKLMIASFRSSGYKGKNKPFQKAFS